MIDPKCYIEIPADKLRDAVKLAFDFSAPQGLGFLHHREGGLEDEVASKIIDQEGPDSDLAASMDYVYGRSCKFHVYKGGENNDRLFVPPSWYDHSDRALEELLTGLGVESPAEKIAAAQAAQVEENSKLERAHQKGGR